FISISENLFFHFSYGINHSAVNPFYCRHNPVVKSSLFRFSAYLFRGLLQLLYCHKRQPLSSDGVKQVLAAWIDGDTPFGNYYVNELAGPAQGGHTVNNHRDPVAEQRDGYYYVTGMETI